MAEMRAEREHSDKLTLPKRDITDNKIVIK